MNSLLFYLGERRKFAVEKMRNLDELPKGTNTIHTENWQLLAVAVVTLAAKEYRKQYLAAYHTLTAPLPGNSRQRTLFLQRRAELERKLDIQRKWFQSAWCEGLSYFGSNGAIDSASDIPKKIEESVAYEVRKKAEAKAKAKKKKGRSAV